MGICSSSLSPMRVAEASKMTIIPPLIIWISVKYLESVFICSNTKTPHVPQIETTSPVLLLSTQIRKLEYISYIEVRQNNLLTHIKMLQSERNTKGFKT